MKTYRQGLEDALQIIADALKQNNKELASIPHDEHYHDQSLQNTTEFYTLERLHRILSAKMSTALFVEWENEASA